MNFRCALSFGHALVLSKKVKITHSVSNASIELTMADGHSLIKAYQEAL